MLWIKAFHIIFMVAWFSGLFYLPRLFVYHVKSQDLLSQERFVLMEKRLFYYIMTPAALLTTLFGLLLITYNVEFYTKAIWFHVKMTLVLLLWAYHIYCAYLVRQFARHNNQHSERFYRWFNEFPTLILVTVVLLVVLKPF